MTITKKKHEKNTFELNGEFTIEQLMVLRSALIHYGTPIGIDIKIGLELAAHKAQIKID